MMKKIFSKVLALALVLVLSLSVFSYMPIAAAEDEETASSESDYSPLASYYVVTGKTKTFTGKTGNKIIANCYFERPVLVGFAKGLKKINKAMKKLAKKADFTELYDHAKAAAEESNYSEDIYVDRYDTDITYYDNKYICFNVLRSWYAGGVTNTFLDGYVFDLNTGKRKTITQVTGLSEEEIKIKITESILADDEFKDLGNEYAPQVAAFLSGISAKDINFGIEEDGHIAVFIHPYTEPFYGGWALIFDLECTVAE